jgi:uncharacterized protein
VRVYLDSNIVLYLIEQTPGFGARAEAHTRSLAAGGAQFVVSDLTRIECRSTPLAAGDSVTLGEYDSFFQAVAAEVVLLTTSVCDRATWIRGTYRLKVPDSLHLAASIERACDIFLTNDHQLVRCSDIRVELLR